MRALLQQDLRADNHKELINNSDQRGRKSRGRETSKTASGDHKKTAPRKRNTKSKQWIGKKWCCDTAMRVGHLLTVEITLFLLPKLENDGWIYLD